jgi:hypothetical protein
VTAVRFRQSECFLLIQSTILFSPGFDLHPKNFGRLLPTSLYY